MYSSLENQLKEKGVRLVAVSKTQALDKVQAIYDQGQRIFGENRVQELVVKQKELPKDIEWHVIGSLQTNKVKHIASFVSLIHSVDSLNLVKKINQEAIKHNRIIPILLQVKISNEESKQGFEIEELNDLLEHNSLDEFNNIRIDGLMGMASFTSDLVQVRTEFLILNQLFDHYKKTHFKTNSFEIKSMGMSGDYELAIECGSNMVRIGSLIFGSRD